MKKPDFEEAANKYVVVIKTESATYPPRDVWQVCVKQNWSSDLDDVEHYDNYECADALAAAIKRSVETALREGLDIAAAGMKDELKRMVEDLP